MSWETSASGSPSPISGFAAARAVPASPPETGDTCWMVVAGELRADIADVEASHGEHSAVDENNLATPEQNQGALQASATKTLTSHSSCHEPLGAISKSAWLKNHASYSC